MCPSRTQDTFLLALLFALRSDADPWDDLQRVLRDNGIGVSITTNIPARPSKWFDRDGSLKANVAAGWQARESIIRRFRTQHVLTLHDPDERPAPIWRGYLQRLAVAQIQAAEKEAEIARVGTVAFDDPSAAYVIAAGGETFPYQLRDAYAPLLSKELARYRRTKQVSMEVQAPDAATVLLRSIRTYSTHGGVELAGYLKKSVRLNLRNAHRGLSRAGAPLVLMKDAGPDARDRVGPLSPSSVFEGSPDDESRGIEAQLDSVAFVRSRWGEGILPARMEEDRKEEQEDQAFWNPLLAVATTTQERGLIETYRSLGKDTSLSEVARRLGRSPNRVHECWTRLTQRASAAQAQRRKTAPPPVPHRPGRTLARLSSWARQPWRGSLTVSGDPTISESGWSYSDVQIFNGTGKQVETLRRGTTRLTAVQMGRASRTLLPATGPRMPAYPDQSALDRERLRFGYLKPSCTIYRAPKGKKQSQGDQQHGGKEPQLIPTARLADRSILDTHPELDLRTMPKGKRGDPCMKCGGLVVEEVARRRCLNCGQEVALERNPTEAELAMQARIDRDLAPRFYLLIEAEKQRPSETSFL